MSRTATPGTVIAQLVETMRALAGSHPGFRPVHAKTLPLARMAAVMPWKAPRTQAGLSSSVRHAACAGRRTCKAKQSPRSFASPMRVGIRMCTMASPTHGRWR